MDEHTTEQYFEYCYRMENWLLQFYKYIISQAVADVAKRGFVMPESICIEVDTFDGIRVDDSSEMLDPATEPEIITAVKAAIEDRDIPNGQIMFWFRPGSVLPPPIPSVVIPVPKLKVDDPRLH